MTSRFSRLLQASGIVQVETDQTESVVGASPSPPGENSATTFDQPRPVRTTPATNLESGPVAEQTPFADLYRGATVPPSPFTAEKLLKLMDGLSSMPEEVRRQAIRAMDDADDSWTIEDVILDAQLKVKTLAGAKKAIAEQVAQASRQAEQEAIELGQRQQDAAAQIRKQVSDLNSLLDRETGKVSQQIAEVKAKARSNEEAGMREAARLETEIVRLNQIPAMFSGPAGNDQSRNAT